MSAHSHHIPGRMSYAGHTQQAVPVGAGRGRARACTSCRQVKLKCDAKERAPKACTRCESNGYDCKLDPGFKRIPARRALEEFSNRLSIVQSALGLQPDSQTQQSLADYMNKSHKPNFGQRPLPGSAHQTSVPDRDLLQEEYGATSPNFYAIEDETETGEWKLGGVSFTADQIRILFKHFDRTHYKHGPFLEPCTSLHDYHKKSELLFWTVTMIGCFVFNEFDKFYWELLPHHRRLLSSLMISNRVTLSTVHAMLCMATWTYPVSTEFDDLTWTLCGLAIHMGMFMGLHKPGHEQEYSLVPGRAPGSQYVRNVTWLSIFITSTGISSWLGMPPPLGASSHLETISALCKNPAIPKWYRARADIHRSTVQLVNGVDSQASFQTRRSLIGVYEGVLDRVKEEYEDVWNDDLEIEWEGARLYLYGIAFVQPTSVAAPNNFEVISQAREILLKGLAAAVNCLETVRIMQLPPTAPGDNRCKVDDHIYELGFYPKHFFRIGAFANYYLLWFLAVDKEAIEQDKTTAKTYITFTIQLLKSFTHSYEHKRAGEAIEMLAHMPMAMKVLGGSHNTRGAASLMFAVEQQAGGRTAPGLGIDSIGQSDQWAHPNVSSEQQSGSSVQANVHSSSPSTYRSGPSQSPEEERQYPAAPQWAEGSTPKSTQSAPGLMDASRSGTRDFQHFQELAQATHQQQNRLPQHHQQPHSIPSTQPPTSIPGMPSLPELAMLPADQQMAIMAHFQAAGGLPGGGLEAIGLSSAGDMPQDLLSMSMPPSFDPTIFLNMPQPQFQYPFGGDWNPDVLHHSVGHHDAVGQDASGFLDSVHIGGGGGQGQQNQERNVSQDRRHTSGHTGYAGQQGDNGRGGLGGRSYNGGI